MSFWQKYEETRKKNNSCVCVGLDSDFDKIPEFLKKETNPLLKFNQEIIDATKDKVLCYKPNFAFYIRHGKKGVEALIETIKYIPNHIPVILDIKASAWGNSAKLYAKTIFEDFGADSVTINALAGEDVYNPFLEYTDKMLFVLVFTSNPSSKDFFAYNNLWATIADNISGKAQNIGAVVGPSNRENIILRRNRMKETLFLIPGIGAQGGEKEAVIVEGKHSKADPKIIINSSRSIIFASDKKDFAEVASKSCETLRNEINHFLTYPKNSETK